MNSSFSEDLASARRTGEHLARMQRAYRQQCGVFAREQRICADSLLGSARSMIICSIDVAGSL